MSHPLGTELSLLQERQRHVLKQVEHWSDYLQPLTTREVVERGINLANECTHAQVLETFFSTLVFGTHGFTKQQLHTMTQGRSPVAKAIRKTPKHVPPSREFAEDWWNSIENERAHFRRSLQLIVEDIDGARSTLQDDVTQAIGHVVPVVKLHWNGHILINELQHFALTTTAACGYVLARLLDEEGGIGQALRICKLEACSRYFLSLPTGKGGRPPIYCSPEHQALASALTSAERTERWRQNRKVRKQK